jgi:diguanylate cyclase (GGDEF)-like protein
MEAETSDASRDVESAGRLLIVDDQDVNRTLLTKLLVAQGYEVREASGGEQALQLMSAWLPDVVLLDLMMPGMNGFDVLRAKALEAPIAGIPVVMLTADTQPAVKVEGLELGVSDYLIKPFSPPELRARVRNLVRLRAQELELNRLNAQLAREASSDALTGLANRRGFDAYWQREVSRAKRYKAPIALALFDIDHFKMINDQYGHAAGDQVLASIASLMLGHLRESDLLARVGGEEFALALPLADEAAASTTAQKLCGLVSQLVIPPLTAPVTLSAGVASSANLPPGELAAAADRALYHAKNNGRNRVSAATSLTQ